MLLLLISVLSSMMSYVAYYGHVQNTSHLGHSITTSHLLGALVEVPCWVVPIIINKAGRRSPLITFFLLATVFSLGYGLICEV